MKNRILIFVSLAGLCLTAGIFLTKELYFEPETPPEDSSDQNVQLGLNFISFFWDRAADEEGNVKKRDVSLDTNTPLVQPDAIFKDFGTLGVNAFRQLAKADLTWSNVEPKKGTWDFTAQDAVIKTAPFPPIVTLFAYQYASATPPWGTQESQFQTTLGPDAEEYIKTVVSRYAPYVKYWEIGNEMDHWRASNEALPPNLKNTSDKIPSYAQGQEFTPEEQGSFFAATAKLIRENDPDAVVLMPGMSGLNDYSLKTWLPGFVKTCPKGCFDILNYHYYGAWSELGSLRDQLGIEMQELGLSDTPVWMTETGSTSSSSLTLRTDYPNTEKTQADDVFRRIITAWGHGDSAAFWHTYIGSKGDDNVWRDYGLRTANGEEKAAYSTFQWLSQTIVPFTKVTKIVDDAEKHIYSFETSSGTITVAWGTGTWELPKDISFMSSVEAHEWTHTTKTSILLSEVPILVK